MTSRMERDRGRIEMEVLRHGAVAELSETIEAGEKPPYEQYVRFMQGEIDPPIDVDITREVLEEKIKRGEIMLEDINVIIHSTKVRGEQTAQLIKELTGRDVVLRRVDELREINFSMEGVSEDFYNKAETIGDVRTKSVQDFLDGAKVDEDVVDAFRRAQYVCRYVRRIRAWTKAKPLFITHGLFFQVFRLALEHEGEELDDKQVRKLMQDELGKKTERPGLLGGVRIEDTEQGAKIIKTML